MADDPQSATATTTSIIARAALLFVVFYLIAAPSHYYWEWGVGLHLGYSFLAAAYDPIQKGVLALIAFSILIEMIARVYSYPAPSRIVDNSDSWLLYMIIMLFFVMCSFVVAVLEIDKKTPEMIVWLPQVVFLLGTLVVLFVVHKEIVVKEEKRSHERKGSDVHAEGEEHHAGADSL